MKATKNLFTIIIISFLATATTAQTGLQKIFVSSVVPNVSNKVSFELPGKVETGFWDRKYIKVEIDVKTNLKNNRVFNYLNESGRYKIEKGYDDFCCLVLNLPNIKDKITVNGNDLEESFKFKVMIPWDMEIKQENDLTVDYNLYGNEGNLSLVEEINQ